MDNKIKVGDIVCFLDDKGGGKVLSINDKKVLILDNEGFKQEYPLHTVIKKNNQYNQQLINAFIPKNTHKETTKKGKNSIFRKKTQLIWEIDVHIENILSDFYHMTNHEIISLQLEICEKIINVAQQKNIRKLVIIHGKGQGVLRNQIHQMLYSLNLDFKDADYLRYSGGATDIFFS